MKLTSAKRASPRAVRSPVRERMQLPPGNHALTSTILGLYSRGPQLGPLALYRCARISDWYAPVEKPFVVVVLMHGRRSPRVMAACLTADATSSSSTLLRSRHAARSRRRSPQENPCSAGSDPPEDAESCPTARPEILDTHFPIADPRLATCSPRARALNLPRDR